MRNHKRSQSVVCYIFNDFFASNCTSDSTTITQSFLLSLLQLINLLPHAMAPLHILCKGYLGSVLNQSGGADKSRPLGSNHVTTERNGGERMEVDSDSEVEILTPDASESPKSNGTGSPGAARISLDGGGSRGAQQSLNLKVESELRKIAKVELNLSI